MYEKARLGEPYSVVDVVVACAVVVVVEVTGPEPVVELGVVVVVMVGFLSDGTHSSRRWISVA
jgi:hypothetical protein